MPQDPKLIMAIDVPRAPCYGARNSRGSKVAELFNNPTGEIGTIYLIHFDRPLPRGIGKPGAQHYLGWSSCLHGRLMHHAKGTGSRLMAAVKRAGISWHVAATWQGDRNLERVLHQKGKHQLCPACKENKRQDERLADLAIPFLHKAARLVGRYRAWHIVPTEDVVYRYGRRVVRRNARQPLCYSEAKCDKHLWDDYATQAHQAPTCQECLRRLGVIKRRRASAPK